MTYRGHIENGLVVLDDSAALPEGASVQIEVLERRKRAASRVASEKGLRTKAQTRRAKQNKVVSELMKFSGIARDLPADASVNIDHYLYGHPKR